MRKKRLLCVLLALLLTLQTGWAADMEALPEDGVVNVVVPADGRIVINPYRLAVNSDGGETADQIVHAPQALTNLSGFPVTVNVTVTGTVPAESRAAFVSAPPSPDARDKEVFLYAEFQPYPDWWEGRFYDLPNQVSVSEWGDAKENVLTLDAQGEGYFRLFGEMSETPEEPWSKTDTFGAVLTFTFAPVNTDPAQMEEPKSPEAPEAPPEEELPEEPVPPDTPEEVPPTESVDPELPEEVPPEKPETPALPEEVPPQGPETPAPPEEEPPEDPGSAELPEPDVPAGPDAPAETNQPEASDSLGGESA